MCGSVCPTASTELIHYVCNDLLMKGPETKHHLHCTDGTAGASLPRNTPTTLLVFMEFNEM